MWQIANFLRRILSFQLRTPAEGREESEDRNAPSPQKELQIPTFLFKMLMWPVAKKSSLVFPTTVLTKSFCSLRRDCRSHHTGRWDKSVTEVRAIWNLWGQKDFMCDLKTEQIVTIKQSEFPRKPMTVMGNIKVYPRNSWSWPWAFILNPLHIPSWIILM